MEEHMDKENKDNSPIDWDAWLTQHGAKLLLYARSQARYQCDAEDILQDSIIQLVRSVCAEQFRGERSKWLSYVYTAIRHNAMDRARRIKVSSKHEEKVQQIYLEESDAEPWLSSESDQEHFRAEIEGLLKSISPDFAEVIILRIWNELSFQEIADIIQRPLATVSSRYRYGIQALRKILPDSPFNL